MVPGSLGPKAAQSCAMSSALCFALATDSGNLHCRTNPRRRVRRRRGRGCIHEEFQALVGDECVHALFGLGLLGVGQRGWPFARVADGLAQLLQVAPLPVEGRRGRRPAVARVEERGAAEFAFEPVDLGEPVPLNPSALYESRNG